MLEVLITSGVGVLSGAISSVVTWILARRKYQAETDGDIILNMKESLDFYKLFCDDSKERLEELTRRNDELEKRDSELEREVALMKNLMISLMTLVCLNFSCKHREGLNKEEFNLRFKD